MSVASLEQVVGQLRGLGVQPGDLLMVHASLRAVGPVDGGAAGLVAALEQAVTPAGTLLMVLGAVDEWSWVNEHPEAERPRLLAASPPFDGQRTPADPDVGRLAEVFRCCEGTVVSDHPEGRFGARGRLARRLVENPPWHDYYGPGSALQRLVEHGGKVLRLGADPDTVTVLHYAEYLADVPHKRRVRRHRLVAAPEGPRLVAVECLDDEHGIVDHPGEDYFAVILRAYLAAGEEGTARGRVGAARSELLGAAPLVAFAARWMEEHLRPPRW